MKWNKADKEYKIIQAENIGCMEFWFFVPHLHSLFSSVTAVPNLHNTNVYWELSHGISFDVNGQSPPLNSTDS